MDVFRLLEIKDGSKRVKMKNKHSAIKKNILWLVGGIAIGHLIVDLIALLIVLFTFVLKG